jgi:hypothetical protein
MSLGAKREKETKKAFLLLLREEIIYNPFK